MHHFALIERFLRERQLLKERLKDLDHYFANPNSFVRSLSFQRTKLDEQLIDFRRYYAQLRSYAQIYHNEIQPRRHIEKLFDDEDRKRLIQIEKSLPIAETEANRFDEKINHLSTLLNQFHKEHARLIDRYAKSIRLFSDFIQKNDDLQFDQLEILLKNEKLVDHRLYENLRDQLFEMEDVDDEEIIENEDDQLEEYRAEYEQFIEDLKLILQNRQELFSEYDFIKNQLEDWLNNVETSLKRSITLPLIEQYLLEHSNLPIDLFRSLSNQLIGFYSSKNLIKLYERWRQGQTHMSSETAKVFHEQTEEIVNAYEKIKERLIQLKKFFEEIQLRSEEYHNGKERAEETIEKAKKFVQTEEYQMLPLDRDEVRRIEEKFRVKSIER